MTTVTKIKHKTVLNQNNTIKQIKFYLLNTSFFERMNDLPTNEMSAPTDQRTNEKKKLRCTDLNMSETTNSKLPTQTGLPKINFKLKQKIN